MNIFSAVCGCRCLCRAWPRERAESFWFPWDSLHQCGEDNTPWERLVVWVIIEKHSTDLINCVVKSSDLKSLVLVVRSAEAWSRMMAFFYYKAARPPFLCEADGKGQEKVPLMSW